MSVDVCQKLAVGKENFGACTGKWWSQSKTHLLQSVNPANSKILGSVYVATAVEYEIVVNKSLQAFQTWREVPAPKRGEVIRLIGQALRQQKDYLGTLVSLEVGKIKSEGDGEVQEMIDMADFAVGLSRMLYGKTISSERFRHQMIEQWQPLGPIGVITAFNFPVAVWAWNAFLAAICGNTIIWKPSSKAPLVALAVQHICNEVMQQCGCESIFSLFISSDNDLASKMVEDKRLPLISFTGSTAIGRRVSQAVAKRLGKCLLELGGNNGIIITESADFKKAIPSIVFGAVGTAGQRCTSTRRVFVQESRYQELVDKLVAAYKTIKIGNPLEKGILLGPIIDQNSVENYKAAIAELKSKGAKILIGGKVLETEGFFVEPTIAKVQYDWEIVQRETFAPILYLITYRELSEAISMHNNVSQGLSSAIFTENLQEAQMFISAIGSDCGIANVNIGTSGAEIGGAFGGEKETGGGREAGSDSWKTYMRRQTTTINWSDELALAQGVKFDLEN